MSHQIDQYQQAFTLLKAKTPIKYRHLISWYHVEEIVKQLAAGTLPERIRITHTPGEPGEWDHPDWEDYRIPSIPESIDVKVSPRTRREPE